MSLRHTLMMLSLLAAAAFPGRAPAAAVPGIAPPSAAVPGIATPAAAVPRDSATTDSARAALAAGAQRLRPDSVRTVDYLWVVRTALLRPAEIPALILHAHSMGVRGLLVQVVGRGDAYYRSDLLPRSEALAAERGLGADYDPLAEVLAQAHAAGLEVHAWINCMLVWSSSERPRDHRHAILEHPDWIACTSGGRKLSRLTVAERVRFKLEGVYLAPAQPAVRHFIARIATEIARRYPVDGIHLDYIRQPDIPVGYDPATRLRFSLAHGVDPLRRLSLPRQQRAYADSVWSAFQREQITATVREVGDSLRAVRPGLSLSAAVLADTIAARGLNAQDWTDWVRRGLVDRAFVMCYSTPVQTVMDQLTGFAETLGVSGHVVPGIAVYNTPPGLAAAKILGARALGFPLLALYSYDALEEHSSYWPSLRGALVAAGGGRP